MKIKTVLFDLDGTLLPMDLEIFVRAYFMRLAEHLAPKGYETDKLIRSIRAGISAMVGNDGSRTNEEAFWSVFVGIYGEKVLEDKAYLDTFYTDAFSKVREVCGYTSKAREVLDYLKAKGIPAVLATSPLFPAAGTRNRMGWAGLTPEDFVYYTTYENSRFCKPNPEYYREILEKLELVPEECLMVGNDVTEDMVAGSLGIQVFLLTDCLINKYGEDLTPYPRGGYDDLFAFLEARL